MNIFDKKICSCARLGMYSSIANCQSGSMCHLQCLLGEQVYYIVKIICREVLAEFCKKKYKDTFQQNSTGKKHASGEYRRTSRTMRLQGGTENRLRRKKRVDGGHDYSYDRDRMKKGVGNSKFELNGFEHNDKQRKVKKSRGKNNKSESNDKSFDGKTKRKVKNKQASGSDNNKANRSDQKRKRKLKEKRNSCNSDKSKEERRGKFKGRKELTGNDFKTYKGKKSNNMSKDRVLNIIVKSMKDLKQAKQKSCGDVEETNPTVKMRQHLMRVKVIMARKQIGISQRTRSDNEEIKRKFNHKIEGKKTVMESEDGNQKKSLDEYIESDDSENSENTDESEELWENTSNGKGEVALMSDLHMKIIKSKRSDT